MTTDLLKPELSFLNNMDLAHKNAWAPFSSYTLQLHMDFYGFKWLTSFCACSFQISIIMFIFLYRQTGGDDHADQRGKACLKCFCDTFDSDRCMNSLTRGWMSMCSRSMIIPRRYKSLDYTSFLNESNFGATGNARCCGARLLHQFREAIWVSNLVRKGGNIRCKIFVPFSGDAHIF